MVKEIPAGPCLIGQGFWYYPDVKDSELKYATICVAGDDNVERIFIPEMLLDERGHNTMVCHGKYTEVNILCEYENPEGYAIFLGMFKDKRPICDTYRVPNMPIDTGGAWSIHATASKSKDGIEFQHGAVTEFRGRWKLTFRRTSYAYNTQARRWNVTKCECSTQWRDRGVNEFDPPDAPVDHVGSVVSSDTIALYEWDVGKLIDYKPKTFFSPRHYFRFDEPRVVEGKDKWDKDVMHAFLEAHVDAMSRFPKQADNDLANSIEVGGAIVATLFGDPDAMAEEFAKQGAAIMKGIGNTPKRAARVMGGLWLSYRYAYSTSDADSRQRVDYLAREAFYNNVCPKCYGQSTVQTHLPGDVEAVVKHSFRPLPNEGDLMSTIKRRLYEGGIMPSLYKGWDLVPYSFVLDWFGDQGDYLEGLESIHHAREYIYSESCYSLKYDIDVEIEGIPQRLQMYTRVYELPPLDEQYWGYTEYSYRSSRGSTVKTMFKRSGDVGALSLNFF